MGIPISLEHRSAEQEVRAQTRSEHQPGSSKNWQDRTRHWTETLNGWSSLRHLLLINDSPQLNIKVRRCPSQERHDC